MGSSKGRKSPTDQKRPRSVSLYSGPLGNIEFLTNILEFTADAIVTIDEEGLIVQFNTAAEQLFGYGLDEVIGKNISAFMPEFQAKEHDAHIRRYVETRKATVIGAPREVTGLHKDGSKIPLELNVREFAVDGVLMFTGIARDLSDIKRTHSALVDKSQELERANKRLEKLGLYDPLTGLANRTLFFDRLENIWSSSTRNGSPFAVLMIDLDKFKPINDSLGHRFGDAVLKAVALRLKKSLRAADTVGRIGGDEFAAILPAIEGVASVEQVVERMLNLVQRAISVDGHSLNIGMSIGIAIGPADGDAKSLLSAADAAMYKVKGSGGGYCIADPAEVKVEGQETEDEEAEQIRLTPSVLNDITLHFQPTVNMDTGDVIAIEGLVRGRAGADGHLNPHDLVAQAKSQKRMWEFTKDVIDQGLEAVKSWQGAGYDIPISLNVDGSVLERRDIEMELISAVNDAGLSSRDVGIEIAETELDGPHANLMDALFRLRGQGFSIGLDHFGTGATSFELAAEIPANQYKLDMSFVHKISEGPLDQAVVRSIANLAENMGVSFIAVGVEDPATCWLLRDGACSLMQGFLFGEPMNIDELLSWLAVWPDRFAELKTELDASFAKSSDGVA